MCPGKRIGVHYQTLKGGGAPRIVQDQIEYLLAAGHHVTFITLESTEATGISHKNFHVVSIEQPDLERDRGLWRRSISVRHKLRELNLDVLISHSVRHGIRLGVLGFKLPMRQIIVDHAHPPTTLSLLSGKQRAAIKFLLRGARWLCVSKGAAEALSELTGRPVGYIYNYAPDHGVAAKYRRLPRSRTIVALGRFASEKQFNLLIRAFEKVSGAHPDWSLQLYGAGPEKENLLRQANSSTCSEQIEVFNWIDEPLQILGQAGVFAQTSRYEGFGMALVEAMSVGTPVISFNCQFGPSEIISDGKDGLLVKDQSVEAFSEALDQLMSAPDLRQRLGSAAISVTDRFSKEANVALWLHEIEQMTNCRVD